MFDTLFGAEMPLAVRFFLAFLIVLGLIGATAWAVRRFGTGRLGANTRGRQPRLAVIDYASVDGRRRLILVRRDNVEHLLMIGGPTDVVVESNIVRAVAAPRDVARDLAAARPTAGIEALPRAIPLPENGSSGNGVGSWPLQPEPIGGARPSSRIEPLPDEPPPRVLQPLAETQPRPPRDTLAALADELSARPAPPLPLPRNRPTTVARPQPDEDAGTELHPEPRIEPRKPIAQPAPAVPAAAPAASSSAPAAATEADHSIANMAERLEAALRKPIAAAEVWAPATPARAAPAPEQAAPTDAAPPPPPPRTLRPSDLPSSADLPWPADLPSPAEAGFAKTGAGFAKAAPKPARTEAKPNPSKTTLYDSLEQEMASLLGRPTKT